MNIANTKAYSTAESFSLTSTEFRVQWRWPFNYKIKSH